MEALFQLPPSYKKLGIRLLHKRCGPPPWNLIEDPKNQAFLKQLRDLGINTDPWIQPHRPLERIGKNGIKVKLIFEEDPLEIFYMGGHFKTCLSPGDCNFFSVITNAADINKQVVYAYDERDRVVGRCLLALTEDGKLQTFEPYCHDKSVKFDKIIGELADDLARQMNTFVVLKGNVPSLVAPDWYDDGPQDLCNRFEFLKSNSTFRKSLKNIDLTDLISSLKTAFNPLALNALTLNQVIWLSELDDRPELVIPLIPLIKQCRGLSDETWVRAARLAYLAGEYKFAYEVIIRQALPYLLRQHRLYDFLDCNIIELLIEINPSKALRALRKTRQRGIRSDEQETDLERRELLAKAHEALGRIIRAKNLREHK